MSSNLDQIDSTLFFNPFQVVYINFATKNLLACLHSASSTVETISMIFVARHVSHIGCAAQWSLT